MVIAVRTLSFAPCMLPEKRKKTLLGLGHRPVDTLLREGKFVGESKRLPAKLRCWQQALVRSDVKPPRHVANNVWLALDYFEKVRHTPAHHAATTRRIGD